MGIQALVSHAKTTARQHSHPAQARRNNKPRFTAYSGNLQSNLQGFIHHPLSYPIECRQLRPSPAHLLPSAFHRDTMGLCFETRDYQPPGRILEVSISVRGEVQRFIGQVVLVRNCIEHYEIGIWLETRADAARLRIVEQMCHIEAYLKHKRHYEGPFVSREFVAREWISRFAASFPSFAGQ